MSALLLFLLFGFVLGAGYFAALMANVRALAHGAGVLAAVALPLLRLVPRPVGARLVLGARSAGGAGPAPCRGRGPTRL